MPELGAFGVTATAGWKAWVIRKVTRSAVNHAFVYVGHGHIVEANPSGAALSEASKYPDAIWSTMPLTQDQRERIVVASIGATTANHGRGIPYSWVDVACIGLADLFGWHIPPTVRNRLNRRDRLMCSQLVDTEYLAAGVHLEADGRVPGDVAPSDLLDLIEHESARTPT
jgi:uncharacterized protein YycO